MELTQSRGDRVRLGTRDKALRINLNERKYGAFAEIGAGQEVVRWLFRVGGAAGTIAKSMSAYDPTVSDAIYGTCKRYVSRERLQTMLEHEWGLILERLGAKRGADTEFFVFADTVRAQSYQGNSECHGWMGVKYQSAPGGDPSEIWIHVRMLDRENVQQQEALGVVGINLIYAAFEYSGRPDLVLECLLDDLSTERVEVDMIKFFGPDFEHVDQRLMSLKLVQMGLSNAAMFAADGEILQPSEVLYKRPVLVERGSFRPVTLIHLDMLQCARTQFIKDLGRDAEEPVVLMEITMRNLMAEGEMDYADFLGRADILAATGQTVMVSNYFEYHRLAAYLTRLTNKRIALALGIPTLMDLFEERYYENLDGGILEAFGRLFKNDLRIYCYPLKDNDTGQLVTVERVKVRENLGQLYDYLVERNCIVPIDYYQRDYLGIDSREVLRMIRQGEPGWEAKVPPEVASIIKERRLLGCEHGPVASETPASLPG